VWIKSVLMALPVFAMMANKLPAWVIAEVDKICRNFLWTGSDQSRFAEKSLVAWPLVARPTELGGLGVPDLKLSSIALQTHRREPSLVRSADQRGSGSEGLL